MPFQELIDMAISFMRRIPPRKLVPLAKRYFFEDAIRPLLAQVSSITLLQPPAAWALAPVAPSDELLKRRARSRRLLSGVPEVPQKRIRLEEAVHSTKTSSADTGMSDDNSFDLTPRVDEKAGYIKLRLVNGEAVRTVQAVVASGMGPDGEEENRLSKKRRKRRIRLAIIVGVVVLVGAVALVPSNVSIPHPFENSPSQSIDSVSAHTSSNENTCLADEFVPGSSADSVLGTECSVMNGNGSMNPAALDVQASQTKQNLSLRTSINSTAKIRDIIMKKISNTSTSLGKGGAKVHRRVRRLSERANAMSIEDFRHGTTKMYDIIRKKISPPITSLIRLGAKVQQTVRTLSQRVIAMSLDDYRRLFQAAVRQFSRIIEEANMLSGLNMHRD